MVSVEKRTNACLKRKRDLALALTAHYSNFKSSQAIVSRNQQFDGRGKVSSVFGLLCRAEYIYKHAHGTGGLFFHSQSCCTIHTDRFNGLSHQQSPIISTK
jgi:hypothetical protein